MENGLTIQTLEMDAPSLSIDLPEHLETARYQMANEDGLNGGATYA
jgi:CMP-2-keto-3-deoxyoctulosonic acid synthetase